MILDRLWYSQNWNIGFSDLTPETFVQNKKLGHIQWMKHHYHDRFFADPFILKVTDDDIVVFAEECLFEKPKGCIVELIIDKSTKRLKQRYLLLETESHLSYPAILFREGKVYVYPENGRSGKLNVYIYDDENHKLTTPETILDEAVADATIVETNGRFYLVATKYPETLEKAYFYMADSFRGPYFQDKEIPFSIDRRSSRPAGNFFFVNGTLYRPSQDCSKHYGAGISIMKVSSLKDQSLEEKYKFGIYPKSFKYNLGIHTINFSNGYCVIDGCGYLYPFIGRIYYSFLITSIKSITRSLFRRK